MDSSSGCPRFFSDGCGDSMQSKLDSPMPWIGMYVAAASAIISIAMAVDVVYGFKNKKLYVPSKYFSMNAFSLTILAVAMKLPVDLTNQMLGVNEILARVSSLALMSVVLGNLITSLGTLDNNDIMLNLAAIGTLVITIVVNVCIHISKMLETVGKEFRHTVTSQIYAEQITCTVFMFILLVLLCSWGLAVPHLRRCVNKEYHCLNEEISTKQMKWGNFSVDGLKTVLRLYWFNAKIANPEFLIARSETCAASGAMCLLTALTLLEAWIRMHFVYVGGANVSASNYNWSINWIVIIQTIGVGLGTIAPMFRWYTAAKLKSSKIRQYCFKESLWPSLLEKETLITWGIAPLSLKIQLPQIRNIVKTAKIIVTVLCILAVYLIAVASKLLLLVSAACIKVFLLCFPHAESGYDIDFACITLILGGRLPVVFEEESSNQVNKLIEKGKKKQPPADLIKLLHKSVDFKGVKEFINHQIVQPHDGLNCWSLSIVILTSIAVQLPNITADKIDELLRGVNEGLHFVTLIEKHLNVHLERYRFRIGAEDLWSEVQLYHHCEGINFKRESYEETLKALADRVAHIPIYYYMPGEISPESDPRFWSFERMADVSIIHICSAIIESNKDNGRETEEDLFERLSIMISDIISACLTNLAPLIAFKCSSSAIKEREKHFLEAATILGETEEILEVLQKRKLPGLDPEKAAQLNEWRIFLEQNPNWKDSENPAASATIPQSNEEQVIVIEG